MGREVIISSDDALRVVSSWDGCEKQRVPIERAGALCVSQEEVFCASGDAVWKLHKKTLIPVGLFGGGPDICSLLLSADGASLFALCGEADSVLMLSAKTGEPMLLNRAGANPRGMALDGDVLAVAGGESGLVILFCARSLQVLDRLPMPGPVYSVAIREGSVHALCLTSQLSSLLVTQKAGQAPCMLELAGIPGGLLMQRDRLLAATEGAISVVSVDGRQILGRVNIPGRAVWMDDIDGKLMMLDGYTERLYAVRQNRLLLLCSNARFAAAFDA